MPVFNHLDVIGPEATEFGEMTQNKGYYAIQYHSMSPISVQSKAHVMWLTISDSY